MKYTAALALGALGVVYGDIGTSPLYSVRECFHGTHALPLTQANVVGILSLIFWSLIIVISLKYLVFVMRADNRGEGGILALMSLVRPTGMSKRRKSFMVMIGLFGAALLYGDGIITPAISVLSAVEGLEVATPVFKPIVIPMTIVILIGLFLVQKRGTADIGKIFGPLMLLWFFAIGGFGLWRLLGEPHILIALNPYHAIDFFVVNRLHGFIVLGSVFLVVTGGEALYADMGHFGRRPIRIAWFTLVLPSLLLNYFGQGATLLRDPAAAHFPFFEMLPGWALYPMVALSTIATCIASQAVISGAFSLTRQAVQLGYLPRVRIEHTSAREIGQIYIPGVNTLLMIGTIGLVLGFESSSNLAGAYGVAVTTTMVITTILLFVASRELWKWPLLASLTLLVGFLVMDLAFFGANIIKVMQGGWFPLAVGAIVFILMTTWRTGRRILNEKLTAATLPISDFMTTVNPAAITRVPGTAVFLYRNAEQLPPSLLHSLKHYKVLHERIVILTVNTEEIPHISIDEQRVHLEHLGHGIYRLMIRYGFMEDPDIPGILATINEPGLSFETLKTTYFLGHETLIATKHPGMALWREKLFAMMMRNATSARFFFRLPPNRIVEIGSQIEI